MSSIVKPDVGLKPLERQLSEMSVRMFRNERFIQIVTGSLILITLVLVGWSSKETNQELTHRIRVSHPGIHEDSAKVQTLIQRLDKTGLPQEYYFDTASGFCFDGQCKTVTVRIFWDELGYYRRYELSPGNRLEKAEGKPFTVADHKKLHQILADPHSPLRDVDLVDIKNHENTGVEVDAVSGATPTLYKDAAVKGAAWTSFTLWHWANGGMSSVIRRITASRCTLSDLRTYLETGDARHKTFALEQMIARQAYDQPTLDVVTKHVPEKEPELTKLALRYLKRASTGVYHSSLDTIFNSANAAQRVMILNAMLTTAHEAPPGFWDRFSNQLTVCRSYQEVDLLLRLIEKRHHPSAEITSKVVPLLNRKDIFIARRAYWFLKDQELSVTQRKKLEAFRRQHHDML